MAKLNNTPAITKFIFKREWIIALIWFIILIPLTTIVALAFENLYGNPLEMAGMAETMQNPAMVAMVGPIFDINNYHMGAMMGQMMLLFTILAVAAMNIFLVIRHTRKDEEAGRIEVIRSLPVGKHSTLLSTMIVCIIINAAFSILTTLGLALSNVDTIDFAGSLLYGASLGISGLFFGAVAALFAQLSSTSRGALSYSFIFMGIAYLVRAVGDVSINILSYISPLGLVLRTQVYVSNYWWPLLIILGETLIVIGLAFYLNSYRDLGAGIIAAKPGRKEAKNSLLSPLGLTLRLLKNTLIGWGITITILGATYGSIFGDIEKFVEGSEMLKQMFLYEGATHTFAEQFMTTILILYSIMITIPIIIILFKVRTEEKKGRLEHLYAKKISRTQVLFNYFIITIVSSIIFIALYSIGLWWAALMVMTEPIALSTVITGAMVYLPAIWLIIGFGMLLIAYAPKWTSIIWGYLGFAFFVVYLGKLLKMPAWLESVAIYGNIPKMPVEEFKIMPLIILTILAVIMFVISFYGYQKRDLIQQ